MAHAQMLQKIGVLTRKELRAIVRGLDAIGKEIRAGKFKWNPALEDVHMNIEAELTRRVSAGAKLHTARSRNDQVALDIRLWLRDEIKFPSVELLRSQIGKDIRRAKRYLHLLARSQGEVIQSAQSR